MKREQRFRLMTLTDRKQGSESKFVLESFLEGL